MKLPMIMDAAGTDGIGETMWTINTLSPTAVYQKYSHDCEPTMIGHQLGRMQSLICQEKQLPTKDTGYSHQQYNNHQFQCHQYSDYHQQYTDSSSLGSQSPEQKLNVGPRTSFNSTPPPPATTTTTTNQVLKRSSADFYQEQQFNDSSSERKIVRKNGSNGFQGWTSQVEELAVEHLVTDFDGSLLTNADASYNMSEALFKQEAPSPENQHNNVTAALNHQVSQRIIDETSTENVNLVEIDSKNRNNNNSQMLYSNSGNYEYPINSSSDNHVSSSQQCSEFNDDCRFQYILAAKTSIDTKVNEETLTYLNQGQPYEIKLKKLGDPNVYRGKIFKSTVRIGFHERRLRYAEHEQILAWQQARPGKSLLEVDVPLSYGMLDARQSTSMKNSFDFTWDAAKEISCYIKINCISTEFTPKKHGGEKGVPFRIQVETRLSSGGPKLHAASCQVKVYKLKGADRKHKQDKVKIQRQPPHMQEKHQPSYDCTVLTDIPLIKSSSSSSLSSSSSSSSSSSNSVSQSIDSPYSSIDVNSSPQGMVSDSSSPATLSRASPALSTLDHVTIDICHQQQSKPELSVNASTKQINNWLQAHRFHTFEMIFANYSASEIHQLSRDDLIKMCGVAEGIRFFNALHPRAPQPKLSLYFALEPTASPNCIWRAVYLDNLTLSSLTSKLLDAFGLVSESLNSVLMLGPHGTHILVTNDLINNIKDESMFLVETINDSGTDCYKLLLKSSSR